MKLFRSSAPEFLPPRSRQNLPDERIVRSFILGDDFDERELGARIFVVGLIASPLIILFGICFCYLAIVSPAVEQERGYPSWISRQ